MDADQPEADLIAAATHASVVIAATESFRTVLLRYGIEAIGVEDGARVLRDAPESY